MRTLWIDENFRVHPESGEGLTEISTDVFDDMPLTVAACYLYVPADQSYRKPNGIVVHGEFIQPAVSEEELTAAQRKFEQEQVEEYNALVAELSEVYEDADE